MKPNSHGSRAVSLASTLLLSGAAFAAQPVPITNAGFESPALGDGSLQNSTFAGWSSFNGASIAVLNPSSTQDLTAEAPQEQNVGLVTSSASEDGLLQTLASNFQADATYALSVKVANTKYTSGFPGYRVQLVANGTVLAEDDNSQTVAEDSVVTSSVNYSYNAGLHAGLVGQPLQIRLLSKGLATSEEVAFDDVQLTVALANPVAVPGGPYTVFVGGSLFLNGNSSLPSDGQTITNYDWDLNNDGAYGDVTGATPAAISQATLASTWGMVLGGNTIKLRVTDSAAKTSIATATVNILPPSAVVYEPFNYSGTALSGVSGTTEVGLTGTWNASVDSKLGPNRGFGPLVTRGAGIGDLQTGVNRYGGARAISASALAGNGLLNDGATLWFSLIMGYDTGGNVTNSRLAFALATNQFSTANFTYNILDEASPAVTGSGIGVTLGNISGNGKVAATRFTNSGSGFGGNTLGTASPTLYGAGQNGLIVGKITWGTGGGNDTIELYNPGTNLVLPGTPISTLSVAVDQSKFDTITWSRGDKVVMDEIRFGATYQAVIETGSAWDQNGTTAGSGGPTPSGTWNTDAIWNLAPDGTLVPVPWQAGGVAAFSAGTDATGAYTVTVDGTQDIGGLLFEDGAVTISGGTALRMTANATVDVGTGLTATISTPFSESAAGRQMAKAGAGTLVLSGNNAGATGGMSLATGVTQFESPSAIFGTTRNVTIGTTGTMVMGASFGAANIPTTLLGRVVDTSTGTIAADNYASTNFDFSTAGLTGAFLGAVGNVNYTGTFTQNGSTYRLGGGGGTLTMANTNAVTGANSLIANGKVVLAADNDYTGTTAINANATLTITGTSNTSAVTLNTPNTELILGNSASLGAGTLTVQNSFAGPGTLSAIGTVVTTNPVIANTDFNFGGTGALTIGAVTVAGGRTITNNNNTATSTITSITSTASSSLTFAGNGNTTVSGIIGGGSGITTLTKGGTGVLTLNGANTHTGATSVTGGTVKIGNAAALGFGGPQTTSTANTSVTSGFTLDLNGTTDVNEPISLNGTGIGANGALVNNSGTPASIGNGIAGATVAATGSGSGYSTPPTVAINGTGTGATAVASLGLTSSSISSITNGGTSGWAVGNTLSVTGGGGTGAIATVTSVSSGIITGLSITTAGSGYTSAPTTLTKITGGNGTPTITGNATNFCVGGLRMTAAGSGYTGTPTFTFNGNPQTATATLTSVALASASSIGGSGDITINSVVSGTQALTKVGAGTLTLAGVNTYSGTAGTTISGGKLKLGINNALPNTTVAIGAATLDADTRTDTSIGTLNVTGAATINLGSGAALAFANSSAVSWTGTLTLTGTFVSGSSLRFGTDANGLTATQLGLISASGYTSFALDANGYLTASAASGFATWQSANGTSGDRSADHDGDGVSNGIEHFIYGTAANSGFTTLPGVTNTGGTLSVTWNKAGTYTGAYGTDFVVETSATLDGPWTPESADPNPGFTVTFPSANEVKYTFPGGPAYNGKRFARLKVTGP